MCEVSEQCYLATGPAEIQHPQRFDVQHSHGYITSFQVLATGPCSNFQSIPRPEHLGAMALMQQGLRTTLHTDSQYFVAICEKMGYILDVAQMHSWATCDLLLTIWTHFQSGSTKIAKIKAQAITDTDPPTIDTLIKIGNHAADTVAKEALKHVDRISPMHLPYQEHSSYPSMVPQQMLFRHHIQVARAKCLQQQDGSRQSQTHTTFQSNQELELPLQYDVGTRCTFADSDFDQLHNSLWGTTFSHRLLTWLSLLLLPSAPGEP